MRALLALVATLVVSCVAANKNHQLPQPERRIVADYLVPHLSSQDLPPAPTAAEEEATIAACFCEKRSAAGRPCENTKNDSSKQLAEQSSKGCEEELRGMPENDFKKKALADCVCRVLESSGLPCPDPEETKKNAEQDETLKAACVTEAAAAAQEPLKAAQEQKDCLWGWANVSSGVAAKHATCGKANRRRRGVEDPSP